MTNSSTNEGLQPRRESISSPSISSPLDIQAPEVSHLPLDCEKRKQGNEKGFVADGQPQDTELHSAASEEQVDGGEEMVITSIRATDVSVGLRRIPAAFYTIVNHSGFTWRTDNKRVSVDNDAVEWDGPIPIPSDPSETVVFDTYSSFELQPTLGKGEQLRNLTVTVEQLLDCCAKDLPFTLLPGHSSVVSSCTSLSVTVKKVDGGQRSNFSARKLSGSHSIPTDRHAQLERATDQGHLAFSRFQEHGEKRDLLRSIEEFQRALDIGTPDHPCYTTATSNMAMAMFIRCLADDTGLSLAISITLYHKVLSARPAGHPDRPSTLVHLAAVQLSLSEKQQQKTSLEYAEALLNEAKSLSSAGSHENIAANFMLKLLARHRIRGIPAGVRSPNGPDPTLSFIYCDPVALLRRYERFGVLDDLQQAISILKAIISWSLSISQFMIELLILALKHRYKRLGELRDWEEMTSRIRALFDSALDGDPRKSDFADNLGFAFMDRFHHTGELGDLDQAILMFRDAIDLAPDTYPRKPVHLHNLAVASKDRFDLLGELDDLQQVISKTTDAINLTRDSNPQKYRYLGDLSASFNIRFHRLGEVSDLEQVISRLEEAIVLVPNGHPDKILFLDGLAMSLIKRFQLLGKIEDLDQAIAKFGNVVGLVPDGRPCKIGHLQRFGESLGARFDLLRNLGDLEQMIAMLRDAADLIPDDDALKADLLYKLGGAFFKRFVDLGQLSDIEQAISRLRTAVDLTPDGHPPQPAYLKELGTCLKARYERLGELDDIKEAIAIFLRVAELSPDNNSCILDSIGKSFLIRFCRLGEPDDLDRAISILTDAVRITPDDHIHKPSHLSGLAISLVDRFRRLGERSDLEQAILNFKEAALLCPDDHPNKPGCLNDLGLSLKIRFNLLGEAGDLEQSISWSRDAIDLTPDGHPAKPNYLLSLGNSLLAHYHLGHPDDSEEAISSYSHATQSSTGSPSDRFHASVNWISCARRLKHHSLLEACSTAVTLLHDVAWMGVPLSVRCRELRQGFGVALQAAEAALELGHAKTAVEWLEQGRSILWEQLFQLRNFDEELEFAHPDHARRLRHICTALEDAFSTREKALSLLSDHHDPHDAQPVHPTESLEQQAIKHRALAIERDELLQEIRGLPGFERFLLHKEFSRLRASAHSGPVVILNAAASRCDALIILEDVEDVIQVPLLNFTFERSARIQVSLKSMIRAREGQRVHQDYAIKWKSILSSLWKCVAKPVLDALKISTPGNLSRIFWCPTGPFAFLPIHAAGLYDEQHLEPGHKLSDFVVSSYVPNLGILAKSPGPKSMPKGDVRLLVVPQPPSDGLSPLPGVSEEMGYIEEVVQNCSSAPITLLQSSAGTVEEVLEMMKEANWIHFACHGTQDDENPTDSGLCLADGRRLKLSDIISLSRPRGGLAFLSACETAMGDKGLSDESIHIAAGMLFAGYGSVIATMWSISDRIAPRVAKDVYEELFRNARRPDPREAARALQDAVGRIRDGGASFEEWIPFIHVGL